MLYILNEYYYKVMNNIQKCKEVFTKIKGEKNIYDCEYDEDICGYDGDICGYDGDICGYDGDIYRYDEDIDIYGYDDGDIFDENNIYDDNYEYDDDVAYYECEEDIYNKYFSNE